MARYYLFGELLPGSGIKGVRPVTTYGTATRPRQDPWQKLARKKVSAGQWKQLEAISKATYVNHLGRRHSPRDH